MKQHSKNVKPEKRLVARDGRTRFQSLWTGLLIFLLCQILISPVEKERFVLFAEVIIHCFGPLVLSLSLCFIQAVFVLVSLHPVEGDKDVQVS